MRSLAINVRILQTLESILERTVGYFFTPLACDVSIQEVEFFFYRYFIIILIIICCFKYIVYHPYFF